MNPLAICSGGCDRFRVIRLGTGVCCIDKRRIQAHAAALYCPLNPPRFGDGTKPPTWDTEPVEPPIAPARAVNRPAAATPVKPTPRSEWPRPVRALAVLAKPGESGVGDTAQRLIGHMGGEAMKRLYVELVGRDCGCNARRERLNLLYPYL